MALIRQAEAVRMSQQAISLDLGDLAAHAQAIVARARAEADRIVEEGKQERARLVASAEHAGLQQGKAKGLEQGYREGLEKGTQQALQEHRGKLSQLQQQWTDALRAFSQSREELLLRAGEQTLEVALLLAGRIVRQQIAAEPGLVVQQALAAVRLATGSSRVVLRVHEQDAELLRSAMPALVEACGAASSEHVRIEAMDGVERGSVVLDVAGGGRIEATIGGQLDRMATLLLGGSDA
jgi:flagellar assembly protein FliH